MNEQTTTEETTEETTAATPEPDTKAEETKAAPEDATDGLPSDPEQLRKMIKDLRKEAAKDRVAGKEKAADEARRAVLDEISKALGLSKSDEAPELTVEQLTAELAESKAAGHASALELAESKAAGHASALELAVYKAAGDLADPARLLDSQSFHTALKDVDLADAEAVKNAITAFTKDHPHFAKTQAVNGASAIDKPAGSGAEKPKNLQDAIALRFS